MSSVTLSDDSLGKAVADAKKLLAERKRSTVSRARSGSALHMLDRLVRELECRTPGSGALIDPATRENAEGILTAAGVRAVAKFVCDTSMMASCEGLQEHITTQLQQAVHHECVAILEAAHVKTGLRLAERKIAKAKSELAAYKQKQRKAVAEDLRAARAKCQGVSERIKSLQALAHLEQLRADSQFPPPPDPMFAPSEYGDGLPNTPGIYFVWSGDIIVYIGQSVRLQKRATLKHEKISASDMLSFLELPEQAIDYAEAYYIGVCQPMLNFGEKNKRIAYLRSLMA